MISNMKALGLASLAVLAICAVSASVAQAGVGELDVAVAPAVITAQQQTVQHVLTVSHENIPIKCTNATFEGKVTAKGLTEATVTPTFSGCKIGGLPANIHMNGCKYTFTGGVTEETANLDIAGCTAGKRMEIESALTGCIIMIGEQGPLEHIVFENKAGNPEHIVTNFTVSGIQYEELGFECPDEYGTIGNNGFMVGKTTVKAFQLKQEKQVTLHGHQYTEYVCGTQVGIFAT